MSGSVFLVIRFDNAYSNYILTTKEHISNCDKSTAVIYRPCHLYATETSTSITTAGLLNLDTGSRDYKPRYDLLKRASGDIETGETLGGDHDASLESLAVPAVTLEDNHPILGHLLNGNKAKVDIGKRELITYDMVEKPQHSILWNCESFRITAF